MAKAFYEYQGKSGTFAFLQDEAIGAAMGNNAASVGTPRLPDGLTPRTMSIRYGTTPYTYKHYIYGADDDFAGFTFGDTVGGGTVVGFDYGNDNSASAY
jgi:hypothetical protein